MKKFLSLFLSITMLFSTLTTVNTVFASETNIDFSNAINISLDETVDVSIKTEGYVQYFKFMPEKDANYSFYSSSSDDTYVTLYDEYGNELSSDDDSGIDLNFKINYKLNAGETYYFGSKFLSDELTGNFQVGLIQEEILSVESISYAPANLIEIKEYTNGNWDTDDNGNEYFNYNMPLCNNGDVFSVIYNNGISVDYIYDTEQEAFIADNGDMISHSDYSYSDQSSDPWVPNKENYITIYYMGVETRVPVKIIEETNPAESISFKPIKPIEVIEYTRGTWEDDNRYWYYYGDYICESGNMITVNYKDGTIVDYVGDWYEGYFKFISENGVELDYNYTSDQNTVDNAWVAGNTYYIEVSVSKAKTQVPVKIVENPVESISYTPICPIEIIENTNGYWTTNDNGEDYFEYWTPAFCHGDMLTITYNDGTSVNHTYSDNYGGFVIENSNLFISGDAFAMYSNQSVVPWSVGGENYFTIEYMGAEAQVPVTIIENPVDSITFTPIKPYEIIEKSQGYNDDENDIWVYSEPSFNEGDKVTIKFKNGTIEDYICDRDINVSGKEMRFYKLLDNGKYGDYLSYDCEVFRYNGLGETTFKFILRDWYKTIDIPVTIIENPIASIDYKSNSPLKEGVDNLVAKDDNGNHYNKYYSKCSAGDIFTINYKDGSSAVYTAILSNGDSADSNQHIHFESENGDIIECGFESNELQIGYGDAEIYENLYSVGENTTVAKYMGVKTEYNFTIEPTDIVNFKVTPISSTMVSLKYDEGSTNGYYECPLFAVDVTYSDGRTEHMECNSYEDIYENPIINLSVEDDQGEWQNDEWITKWKPGEKHEFKVYCTAEIYDVIEITTADETSHTHSYTSLVTEPTCTERGYTAYTCTCGDSYIDNYVEALGHSFWEYVSNNDATYESDGTKTAVCSRCGEKDTIVDEGSKLVKEPDLSSFVIKTVSLTLQSSIKMNFKVLKSALADFENPYMVFKCEGLADMIVTEYIEQGDYYVFSFPGISPKMMNNKVTAQLYGTYKENGKVYSSETKSISVKEYAYKMLDAYASINTTQAKKLKTLIVDLLNYGAQAQIYTKYKTNSLVNADLTDVQKAWGTAVTPELTNITNKEYKTIENPTAQWNAAGLVLNDSVKLRAKFTVNNIDNITVKITCAGNTYIYSKDDFTKNSDGSYYVYCNEIKANQMSKEILMTVYDNDVQCSNTMRFSVESYAKGIQDSAYAGTALDNLTQAMMRYGKSAEAYGN